MRQRLLPLPEDPARWRCVARTETMAVLARGRHALRIFRVAQEITVLLCASDWTLTPHGIVQGTAAITLFPRAHPPDGCPHDLAAAVPWIAARAAGRPAQLLTAAMEAVATVWAAAQGGPVLFVVREDDEGRLSLEVRPRHAPPADRGLLDVFLSAETTQALRRAACLPDHSEPFATSDFLASGRVLPPPTAHARAKARAATAAALAETGVPWPDDLLS